jgi:hypothetical protein
MTVRDAGMAGTAFGDLIKEQLTQERARKDSIEARGLAVITTAGGIVTILFALSALATKAAATFELSQPAQILLVVATGFFVLAVLVALGTNAPLLYNEVTTDGLKQLVTKAAWENANVPQSERMVAKARARMITSGRASSNIKAGFLIAAMVLEVIAVIVLAIAVAVILLQAPPAT